MSDSPGPGTRHDGTAPISPDPTAACWLPRRCAAAAAARWLLATTASARLDDASGRLEAMSLMVVHLHLYTAGLSASPDARTRTRQRGHACARACATPHWRPRLPAPVPASCMPCLAPVAPTRRASTNTIAVSTTCMADPTIACIASIHCRTLPAYTHVSPTKTSVVVLSLLSWLKAGYQTIPPHSSPLNQPNNLRT
jgi:hypothetical protein